MSSQHTGNAGGPSAGAASATADAARRVRRAVALPHSREETYGSAFVVPRVDASAEPSSLTARAARQTPPPTLSVPRGDVETGSGVRGALPTTGHGHEPLGEDDAAGRGSAGTPAAQAGVTALPASGGIAGAASASRNGHRPLLIAAAVAGALLTAVPFVQGKHTVEADGMSGAAPVATQTSGAHGTDGGDGPEGGTSSLPLGDPLEGVAPVGPQSAPAQGPVGGPDTTKETGRKAGVGHGTSTGPDTDASAAQRSRSADGKQGNAAHTGDDVREQAPRHEGGTQAVTGLTGRNGSAGSSGDKQVAAAVKSTASATVGGSSGSPTTLRSDAARVSVASTTAGHTSTAAGSRQTSPAAGAQPVAKQWSTPVVRATTVLVPGNSVASDRMRLTMRADGNLVISDEDGVTRWSSHTSGRGARAVFQADGHLVVYTADGQTAWSSGTAGNDGAELVLQADGNVTILSVSGTVLWSAGTQH